MSSTNIISLGFPEKPRPAVDGSQHAVLNLRLINFVFRSKVCSHSRQDLVFLLFRMADDGRDLLGDIIQMSRQEILKYASADDRIKNPHKTVDRLEDLLSELGFTLEMHAPEWVRSPQPSFSERIARRNLQAEATGPRRYRSHNLKIVHPDF